MDHEHDVNCERISIARCREILGDEATELSDAEVDQIRRHADVMAHVIVDAFFEQRASRE